jgi:hypothetical protein
MLSKPQKISPGFISLYFSLFSGTGTEVRRQREVAQEDVGVRKGCCQLYSPTVL